MFGWLIRMAVNDTSLFYNGKKSKIMEIGINEQGGYEPIWKDGVPCWTENKNEAVVWTNHIRASRVRKTLGDKAEIVENENNLY